MAERNPKAARLLLLADRQFSKRCKATQEDRNLAKEAQTAMWVMLSEGIHWSVLYKEAIEWSKTVEPMRPVDPGQAIHARAWWRKRA